MQPSPKPATVELRITRRSCHQWIYAKMVKMEKKAPPAGSLVRVVDRAGAFVGIGIFNPRSTIALRILSTVDEPVGAEFFKKRFAELKNLRENVLRLAEGSDCYRLVHSETDGIPGLVIDRFNDGIVVKPYSAGYGGRIMDDIADALGGLYPGCRVMLAPEQKACLKDNADYSREMKKYPAGGTARITEFGVRFIVDFETGHKTGFFLDQKINRRTAASVAAGREVLDLCCYTGGFGISARMAGARSVTCVDLDADALEIGRKNAKLNGCEVDFVHQNVFDYLRNALGAEKEYDLIICDPAKLAANKQELSRAYRTYGDLNKLAIAAVRPGGLLFTFSCSGLVSEKIFQSIVFNSAKEAGRVLKVLMTVGPSPDHPFSSIFPEGKYLKGILCQVDRAVLDNPEADAAYQACAQTSEK